MPIIARSHSFDADRAAWQGERERIDLAAVSTGILGPAAKASGGRLWWRCPFHDERTPSFSVETKPGGRWRCFGCGEQGDAPGLVMRLQSLTFPEARALLTGGVSRSGAAKRPTPPPSGAKPTQGRDKKSEPLGIGDSVLSGRHPNDTPAGLAPEAAALLVVESAARLWTPQGAAALDALRGRGLTDCVILAARLGWCDRIDVPKAGGDGTYRASGVTIPWQDARGRLLLVKIRQEGDQKPKYAEAHRNPAALTAAGGLFTTPATIRAGRPVVIVEGELDALCLTSILGELVAVASLGSASAKPTAATLARLASCPRWWIATDADEAGDRAAALWTQPRARRIRPPEGSKDWTDLFRADPATLFGQWGEALGVDPYDLAERHAIRKEAEPCSTS